jgi:molybdopterin-guanine dinucleotide biosynthesis protein A
VRVVGAVLAGGKSSRMGRDKAGVAIPGDVTLGARAIAVLREVCDDVVILGHGRAMPSDVARLEDAVDDAGPLAGILALLKSGRAETYVVLAVDMPGVNTHHVRSLLRLLSRASPPSRSSTSADADVAHNAHAEPADVDERRGGAIAQSETERRVRGVARDSARAACFAYLDMIEPLPLAIADVDFARDAVERLLARGERSLHALIDALAPAKLAVTDRAVIRNVNTLADFDEDPSAKPGQ